MAKLMDKPPVPMGMRLLPLFALLFGSFVHGAENRITANLGLAVFADNNYGLDTADKDAVAGSRQIAGIEYSRRTEISGWELGADVTDTYLRESEQNETDFYDLSGKYDRRWLRSTFNGELSTRHDSTLSDELLATGPATVDVDRERHRAVLQGNHYLSETLLLGANLNGEEVNFKDNSASLTEYHYYALSVRPRWLYSPQASLFVSLSADKVAYQDRTRADLQGRFQDSFPDEISSRGLGAGWAYRASETLDYSLSLGYRESRYKTALVAVFLEEPLIDKESGTGITIDGSLNYTGERSAVSLNARQQARPNSAGDVVDERTLSLGHRYNLNATAFLATDLSYTEQRSELESQQADDLDSLRANMRLVYRYRENLELFSNVRYLARELVNTDEKAESSRLEFGLRWNLQPLIW